MVLMTKKGNTLKSLAIICDGNRRSSPNNHNLGHKKGAETLKKIAEFCQKKGINTLTVFALSMDNLRNRKKSELKFMSELRKKYIQKEILNSNRFIKEGIRFSVFGDVSKLPKDEQELIKKAEEKTKINNPKMFFNVCLAYSGKKSIINAVKRLFEDNLKKEHITEQSFRWFLDEGKTPKVDLIIRTGNTFRLSNFMLWDAGDAELFFSKKNFPEFTTRDLNKIIKDYEKRDIRNGR